MNDWTRIRKGETDFPVALAETPDAPELLYVVGKLDTAPCVAVVGARRCTRYGAVQARRLASHLAGCGLVVVSGLAYGIDAEAHRGALEAGGRTVAVLPGGPEEVHPRGHRKLGRRIAASGALVTENEPGTEVGRFSFPKRNRIIAGMSLATVVVEAGKRSGARITAGIALGYGREVLAVPGPVTSRVSAGTNALLAEGARVCRDAGDVLAHLPADVVDELLEPSPDSRPVPGDLGPVARRLLDALPPGTLLPLDGLLEKADVPAGKALPAITDLELRGLVVRRGGHCLARTEH